MATPPVILLIFFFFFSFFDSICCRSSLQPTPSEAAPTECKEALLLTTPRLQIRPACGAPRAGRHEAPSIQIRTPFVPQNQNLWSHASCPHYSFSRARRAYISIIRGCQFVARRKVVFDVGDVGRQYYHREHRRQKQRQHNVAERKVRQVRMDGAVHRTSAVCERRCNDSDLFSVIEDDMVACKGASRLFLAILEHADSFGDWAAIRTSAGANGIFFPTRLAPMLSEYIAAQRRLRIIDNLLLEFYNSESPKSAAYNAEKLHFVSRHNCLNTWG